MNTSVFKFTFGAGVALVDVEATLQLAILAAEGLFGESRVRMEVSYHCDAPRSTIVVDGSTGPGDAVMRIYTGFLTREIGPDAFSVRRMPSARHAAAHAGVAA